MAFHSRRGLGWAALAVVVQLCAMRCAQAQNTQPTTAATLQFDIQRIVAHSGFDGSKCWVHARAGAVPAEAMVRDAGDSASTDPQVVMTMQKLLLSGSDVFYALNETRSLDLGASWTEPIRHDSFARQTFGSQSPPTGAEIAPQLLRDGDQTTVCDFTPKWHAASGRLLGIGQTVWYRDNRVMHLRPRGIAYAVYDLPTNSWLPWKTLALPADSKFQSAGAGSAQRVDLPGGDVLIPFYFKQPAESQYSVAVCRCRFDGRNLEFIEMGNELTVPIKRGLYEPSLTLFQGTYYLTIRNDEHAYVSSSQDGLHFAPERKWTFDDGSDLGSYNTQQHWVTHSDALYLVYTRRGADNDHVFRHRAPLFIAQVDTQSLSVIRDSEQILVPERGARLGNFGVTDVSPHETWVTVSEWMQPKGVEQYGSNNSVYVAKLKWNHPNQLVVSASVDGARSSPWKRIEGYFKPPKRFASDLGNYRSPLQFTDGSWVMSAAEWPRRRAELKSQWQQLLGKWPPLNENPQVEILESSRREDFVQHRVRFAWLPAQQRPESETQSAEPPSSDYDAMTKGYLLVPPGAGPHPAVVVVYYEPETAIGLGKPHRDFALQLARRGFVSLSIGTTQATQDKTYALYYPSIERAEVAPLSMLGYAAANAWHVLADRPEVDEERIGIVGHSFGGKWAMFAACLFDKFACAAWSDPGIVFDETRPSVNYWEPWYLGYHPKPWRPRGIITASNPARGLYPRLTASKRDLHELHALMAPRPFLVSGGSEDPLARWQALNHSLAVNSILGLPNRVAMTNRPEHSPNADSNELIYSFFEHFLHP